MKNTELFLIGEENFYAKNTQCKIRENVKFSLFLHIQGIT